MTPLRIGTRGSPLALWQAHHVSGLLRGVVSNLPLELVDIACVQNPYSVVNRAEQDELALWEERGLAFVPFFPLGSALAADAFVWVPNRQGLKPRYSNR